VARGSRGLGKAAGYVEGPSPSVSGGALSQRSGACALDHALIGQSSRASKQTKKSHTHEGGDAGK